eukprot:2259333-Prymnesium_polylepis.1
MSGYAHNHSAGNASRRKQLIIPEPDAQAAAAAVRLVAEERRHTDEDHDLQRLEDDVHLDGRDAPADEHEVGRGALELGDAVRERRDCGEQ